LALPTLRASEDCCSRTFTGQTYEKNLHLSIIKQNLKIKFIIYGNTRDAVFSVISLERNDGEVTKKMRVVRMKMMNWLA